MILVLFPIIAFACGKCDVIGGYDLSFYIFSKSNPANSSINYTDIDVSKPVKILIHGFLQTALVESHIALKDAYLLHNDCNVVLVDWSKYSAMYISAIFDVKHIGNALGEFFYKYYGNTSMQNVHVVGHSLGAHVAGFMGKQIISLSSRSQILGRITGLDPAQPGYSGSPTEATNRLDKDDALMVDIVHTDSGAVSIFDPIGKVDFYPNGGTAPQPGCDNLFSSIYQLLLGDINVLYCDHSKCRDYFRRSVGNSSIIATQCNSWRDYEDGKCDGNNRIIFGESMPLNASGSYYFRIVTETAY